MIVSLFLLRVEFISADSDCRCCSCDRNETKQASKMLRGFSGKRGPPGPPGDVLQCGCNTSEILKQLQNLTKQVNSYKGKLIHSTKGFFFVHVKSRFNVK